MLGELSDDNCACVSVAPSNLPSDQAGTLLVPHVSSLMEISTMSSRMLSPAGSPGCEWFCKLPRAASARPRTRPSPRDSVSGVEESATCPCNGVGHIYRKPIMTQYWTVTPAGRGKSC